MTIEETMPQRSSYLSEIAFARAMQLWARDRADSSNPLLVVCLNDWFAEELLIEYATKRANH